MCQVRPNRPDDDLAGVKSHADLDGHSVRAEDTLRVPCNRLLHLERRITRPHAVIFMGKRSSEQGHDPVAHHLIHCALVAMDGLHHQLKDRIEDLARFLGIAIGEELHRALQVGEEDRDLLALTLERGLGVDDSLGEVLGSVGLRGAEPAISGVDYRERAAAPAAELFAAFVQETARRTLVSERRAALAAEAAAFAVLCVAARAQHQSASSGCWVQRAWRA
jgi:hypothetical protein